MKIVFLFPYFFPEKASSDFLNDDLLKKLIQEGHQVSAIVPFPVRGLDSSVINHYKRIPFEVTKDEVLVHRVNVLFSKGNNILFRFIRSLLMGKAFVKKLKILDFDLVIVPSNPQHFLVTSIYRFVKKKNIPIIYNIRDIYPEIAFRKGIVFNFFQSDSKKSVRYASKIVTLSEDMKNTLIKKGADHSKIEVIPVWNFEVDRDLSENDKKLISEIIDDNFINALYIGNIGEWQNIDILLDCFQYLNKNVRLSLIGGGRRVNEIKSRIKIINSNRLKFYDSLPISVATKLYELADVNIITTNENVVLNAFPSKTASCVTANRPIIASINTESNFAKLIKHFGGEVVSTDSAIDLANAINKVEKNTYLGNELISADFFGKESNLQKWLKLINEFNR